ncbi:hypothetical protein GCM10020358_53480 [Amorphoplanes nipponensis]
MHSDSSHRFRGAQGDTGLVVRTRVRPAEVAVRLEVELVDASGRHVGHQRRCVAADIRLRRAQRMAVRVPEDVAQGQFRVGRGQR